MSLISLWSRILAAVLAVLLSSCGGGSSATPPVGGLTVIPGGGQAVVTWKADPGVTYWLAYAPTAGAVDMKNPPAGNIWLTPVTSPVTVTGLLNGTTYGFAVDARVNGGPGGAQTPTVNVTPRASGNSTSSWTVQTELGTDLLGLSYGTNASTVLNYLAVGTGGTMYSGVDVIDTTYGDASYGLDSVTWTALSGTPTANFKASLYALGQFFAVGTNDTNGVNIYHSTDLVTWTPAATPVAGGLNALTTNGTVVMGVGNNGVIQYSTDGITWLSANSTPTPATMPNLYGVAYSPNGLWVAVGSGGTIWVSGDGLNWASQASNAGTNNLYGVASSPTGLLVAVGQGGTVVSSLDGASTTPWVVNTLAPSNGADLYAVNADGWQFLAVGAGGSVFSAVNPASVTNGVWSASWTGTSTGTARNLYAMYGSSARYTVVGQAGANIIGQ